MSEVEKIPVAFIGKEKLYDLVRDAWEEAHDPDALGRSWQNSEARKQVDAWWESHPEFWYSVRNVKLPF